MNNTSIEKVSNELKATLNASPAATIISKPKKSRYQFYVRTKTPELINAIEKELPKTGRTFSDVLTFNTNHPYKGMLGFNLPGGFPCRKKMANTMFKLGWKWGVLVELNDGGLRPIINRYDHTGSVEKVNTGGCLGCANKNYNRCLGCPDNFKYVYGKKVAKPAFHNHTSRR